MKKKSERRIPLFFLIDFFALWFGRGFLLLMRTLPEQLGLKIAHLFVCAMFFCFRRSRAVGMRNLELMFPEKSIDERKEILRKSYLVLASNLYGFASLGSLTPEKILAGVDFGPAVEFYHTMKARDPSRGLMVITMHYGAFERLVQYHAILARPISILARGFNMPRLDEWWDVQREQFGNKVFRRKGGYREVMQRLKVGEDISMLFDQNVKSKYAVFTNFFGIPAATTRGAGIAAIRTDAQIIFVVMADNCDGTFELTYADIPNPKSFSGDPDQQIEQFTQLLNQKAEEVIRKRPEQWFWVHRRFKTRPNGEPETVYEGI